MEAHSPLPIFVALGGNLDHPVHGAPVRTLTAALRALAGRGARVRRLSPWYRTAPVPPSDQPWYVNAVAEIDTGWPADRLLAELHAVEADFGRVRSDANAARLIDLDLIDYRGRTAAGGPGHAILPHPRLEGRAFVLKPLADLAPDWRHPRTGVGIRALLDALPADQVAERLPSGAAQGGEGLPFPGSRV
ncbi:MAG: 2-amino-4-hydroxy-6-hydroxymethyldihydropteridine diphosphokinase [Pseudomonadota bacterium]